MDTGDRELSKELDATLQARRELGKEYEDELIDSFLEKFDQRLESAVDKRLRRRLAEEQTVVARGGARPRGGPPAYTEGLGARLMPLASMVLAIPLSAIAVVNAGVPGLLTAWAGIVGVNFAYLRGYRLSIARRPKRDDPWED